MSIKFYFELCRRMPKLISCLPLLNACFGRAATEQEVSASNPAGESSAIAAPLSPARDLTVSVTMSLAAHLDQRNTRDTTIAEAKRDLTGVVIWPDDLKNSTLSEAIQNARNNNPQYGKHFHDSVVTIGEDLRRGTIHSFDQLWMAVRDARCAAPYMQYCSAEIRNRFASAAVPGNPLVTKLDQRYSYLPGVIRRLPEVWNNVTVDREFAENPAYHYASFEEKMRVEDQQIAQAQAKGIDPPLHFPDDSLQKFGACTLQMTGVIQGERGLECIPLTAIHFTIPKLHHVDSQIAHTLPEQHERNWQHLDHLLQEAIREPDNNKFKEKALRMYWWSAHACLDLRGSAAKTEMLYRAMLASRGMDCPLWKPGVSADLEAMIRTESQWLDVAKELEWSSQDLGDAIGAPPLPLHPVQQALLARQD